MQYTVWPIAGLYLMNVWPATVYSLAGGLLLAKVYSRWNHAYPWNWDQAWSDGMNPADRKFAAIVWLVLLGSIIVGLLPRLNRPRPTSAPGPDDTPGGTVGQSSSISGQPNSGPRDIGGDMAASLPRVETSRG
jgi:hypothetical protein